MTENIVLNEGFFQELFESRQDSHIQPTLQILRSRVMENSTTICMRMQLSDSRFSFSTCGMSVNLTDQLERDGLKREVTANATEFPIIQLVSFVTNFSEKKTLTVTEYKLISANSPKIGSPIVHNGDPEPFRGISAAKKRAYSNDQAFGGSPVASKIRKLAPTPAGTLPFAALTPYMAVGRWKIKGVVLKKEKMREFQSKTGRGNGTVFSFELAEESGQAIKLSAFSEVAESFNSQIEEGKTYFISGNSTCIRGANKRFNSTGLDYEISLNADCTLEVAEEQIEKPKILLKAAPLDQLAASNNQTVDVLAIIEKTEDCQTITTRDQRELKRRNVQLIDKTGAVALLTLWGAEAEAFVAEPANVIAIKGAYVKEFQGNYSLSINPSSRVEVNPKGEEYDELFQWYERERPNMDVKFAAQSGGSSNNWITELRSITNLTHSSMCSSGGDKGIYFNMAGYITAIRTEGAIYASCSTPNCQKKVQEMDGSYRCEKCGSTMKECKYRYMVPMEISDLTGSTYTTLFDDKAVPFFGKTADEMNALHQNSPDDYAKVLKDKVYTTPMNLRCRGRMETYNDQTRAKFTVFEIRPLDFSQYSQALDSAIEFLEQLSEAS